MKSCWFSWAEMKCKGGWRTEQLCGLFEDKEKGRGRLGGLPESLPIRRDWTAWLCRYPKSGPGHCENSRSRFLPRGAACKVRTSPPGSRYSPLRFPQPNNPANSGRWLAPRAPAPTPSSLLLLPSPDAATAVPRAAASPQPRGQERHLCPRRSVRSRPGGRGWRRRAAV